MPLTLYLAVYRRIKTKRKTKGEGSVYKRGSGRIVGEYEDANGNKLYVTGKDEAGRSPQAPQGP
jgi:hypothetical protein